MRLKNGLRRVDRGDKSTQGGGGRTAAGNAGHETAGTQTGDSRDTGRNTASVVAVGKTLTRCACPTGDGHAMNCAPSPVISERYGDSGAGQPRPEPGLSGLVINIIQDMLSHQTDPANVLAIA